MGHPTILSELIEIAETNGWTAFDHSDNIDPVGGASEICHYVFMRVINDHFTFGFAVTWGLRTETGRWNILRLDDKHPFVGLVFYDDTIIDEWYWPKLKDLKWWLARPDELFERGIKLPNKAEAASTKSGYTF